MVSEGVGYIQFGVHIRRIRKELGPVFLGCAAWVFSPGKRWTSEPERFRLSSAHHFPGLNT